jgi:hypothetical protein
MMVKNLNMRSNSISYLDIIILVVLSGVLWGVTETLLGNILTLGAPSFRAGVLTGTGMAILGLFCGIFRRPGLFPVIAVITAFSVQLAVPILQSSILCKANSSLAILLHAGCLSLMTIMLDRTGRKSIALYSIAGFLSAGLSAVAYYYAGMHLAPCNYLLSFRSSGGIVHFMMKEGALWAVFSSIGYPIGIIAGRYCLGMLSAWKKRSPYGWYLASSAATVAGLALIAATIQYWH